MQNNNGFHSDTKVLMADKTIKEIKDVHVGDVLCGDDNTTRIVTSAETCENGELYLVKQSKGKEYIIGGDHILMLMVAGATPYINTSKQFYIFTYYIKCEHAKCKDGCSKKGIKRKRHESKNKADSLEKMELLLRGDLTQNYVKNNDMYKITICDYLKICDKFIRYDHLNGFKVQYPAFISNVKLPLDPYFLGIWLGDGDYNNARIISIEPEIEQYLTAQPESTFARRLGYLYEWLTTNKMDARVAPRAAYVPVLDEKLQFGLSGGNRNAKFRVVNNLPGMLPAIDLQNQHRLQTNKIHNVFANWPLAAKAC